MKIIYPYYYNVIEIPPRCRNPRPVQYTGELEVEIREPSEAEAPVALILNSRPRYEEEGAWSAQEFRWFDERFWVRRDIDDRGLRDPYELHPPTEPRYLSRYYRDASRSEQEYAEEYIREWARDQILIDGRLWRPWPEPLLKIGRVDGGRNPRTYRLEVEYRSGRYGENVWYYPLTMWDEVYSTLAALAGEDDRFWTPDHCRFDILMPETIRWPLHYHYEFRVGNQTITAWLQVEAVNEPEAIQKVREGLVDAHPDLVLGNREGTILRYPKIKFHSDMVGRHHLIRRVSGLEVLARKGEE